MPKTVKLMTQLDTTTTS